MSGARTIPPRIAAVKSRLLTNPESAAYMAMHPDTWARYWRTHEDLILGRRVVGKRARWPLSVLEKHVEEVCR